MTENINTISQNSSTAIVQFLDENALRLRLLRFRLPDSRHKILSFNRQQDEPLEKLFNRMQITINKLPLMKNVEVNIQLISRGKPVRGSLIHKDAWKNNSTLVVNDQSFNVRVNVPEVLDVKLPHYALTGFPVTAIVELLFSTLEDCRFYWYRQRLDTDQDVENASPKDPDSESPGQNLQGSWIFAAESKVYSPTDDDVDRRLKVRVVPYSKQDGLAGYHLEASTKSAVKRISTCPFEKRLKYVKNYTKKDRFRVLCYNILADTYSSTETAKKELFPYCSPYALDFNYRKILLLKEILSYKADIICLQEVDEHFFDGELSSILTSGGYDGIFGKKAFKVSEGVAIYFRLSKFSLVESDQIYLCDLENPQLREFKECASKNTKFKTSIETRSNTGLFALLKDTSCENRALLVCNTHLYFHEGADHIRLFQACLLVKYMERLLVLYQSKYPDLQVCPIICGDFNSDPKNGVYALMTTGKVTEDMPDWRSDPREIVKHFSVEHCMSLTSSYGTPEYTNYTKAYVGTLDYIFYDNVNLHHVENVPFPPHSDIVRNVALPSVVFPSDHLALISEFTWA